MDKKLLEEISMRRANVAIKDKEHLKEWLDSTGRGFLIFRATDLVDALTFPEGVDDVMRIVAQYRDFRRLQDSGRFESVKDPVSGQAINAPVSKGEQLEEHELNQLLRTLIKEASERFPGWTLAGLDT